MKKVFLLLSFAAVFSAFKSDDNTSSPLWLRYPSISPDGSTIVFTY
ncbi:MAG: PD40 domain-containing protein, partial [Bacteroidia bacterium]|nr:PD40 domain-containing protein [Bacteroidia bacterium]